MDATRLESKIPNPELKKWRLPFLLRMRYFLHHTSRSPCHAIPEFIGSSPSSVHEDASQAELDHPRKPLSSALIPPLDPSLVRTYTEYRVLRKAPRNQTYCEPPQRVPHLLSPFDFQPTPTNNITNPPRKSFKQHQTPSPSQLIPPHEPCLQTPPQPL